MRSRLVVTLVVGAILWTSLPASPGAPTPVRTTGAVERYPAAAVGYLAWSEVRSGKQHVFAQVGSGTPFRVNAGPNGATGGIDGNDLIYQEFAPARSKSDLKLFDLDAKLRANPPTGVNTPRWEYWPDLDQERILFGRLFLNRRATRQVILYRSSPPGFEILAETDGRSRMLQPGQVNGDYATWGRWRTRRGNLVDCEVFVRDLTTGTTTTVPNPDNRCQYGPSVSEDGTVYYGRSGYGCGRSARLMAYPEGGSPETILSFNSGRDLSDTYVYTDASDDHVFYDPASCRSGKQDIFKIVVAG
jgi:hypothetical protein